MTAKKA